MEKTMHLDIRETLVKYGGVMPKHSRLRLARRWGIAHGPLIKEVEKVRQEMKEEKAMAYTMAVGGRMEVVKRDDDPVHELDETEYEHEAPSQKGPVDIKASMHAGINPFLLRKIERAWILYNGHTPTRDEVIDAAAAVMKDPDLGAAEYGSELSLLLLRL